MVGINNHTEVHDATSQVDVYNRVYKSLNEGGEQRLYFSETPLKGVIEFEKTLPDRNNKKLLDIGSGAGRHSILFAKKGYNVTGIESSIEGIKYAKRLCGKEGLKIKFLCKDFLNYKVNKQFDIILDVGCLHHNVKDWKVYCSKISSLLRKDGILFLYEFSSKTKKFLGRKVSDSNNLIVTDNGKHFSYFFRKGELKKMFSNLEIIFERQAYRNGRYYDLLCLKKN